MNPNSVTASRIKQLRQDRGLSQEQFGDSFAEFLSREQSYSLMTISNWETGRKLPPADTIISLAQYFGCSTDYILGLSNDPSTIRTDNSVVNINQKIEVPYSDLPKYDGQALYIKFPDNAMKSQYGLIDFANKQIVLINFKMQLNNKCTFYKTVPQEELTIRSQASHLLNLKDIKRSDNVYIQSLSPDPLLQGEVSGWYHNDISGKFLINDAGRTLSYEGLGVTYNALDYKVSSKSK